MKSTVHITPAMENTDRVLVTYQDGVNWKVGDTVVLHTTSGDKQVTIAGILATSTASAVNGAGSSGYMICSEQTLLLWLVIWATVLFPQRSAF